MKKQKIRGEVQVKNLSRTVMAKPKPAGELDAVALETALLDTWSQENAFQNSIESSRGGAEFIFLDGPAWDNVNPGIILVVARAYMDLVCRW